MLGRIEQGLLAYQSIPVSARAAGNEDFRADIRIVLDHENAPAAKLFGNRAHRGITFTIVLYALLGLRGGSEPAADGADDGAPAAA